MATQPPNSASEKAEIGISKIQVTCPHCKLVGAFPFDRLNPKSRVRCKRCDQWFRIEALGGTEKADAPDAAITVSVRGGLSEWSEHLAPESGRQERRSKGGNWQRYVSWRTGVAAGIALLVIVGIAWRLVVNASSEGQATAYQEPEALPDRAAAFSLAWVCRDITTMPIFTAQGNSAAFASWLRTASGQLPVTLHDVAPNEVKVETTAIAPEKDPTRAIVTVSLELRSGAPPPKDAPGYTHRQAWAEIEGKWVFLPEETLKLLRSPKASPWK